MKTFLHVSVLISIVYLVRTASIVNKSNDLKMIDIIQTLITNPNKVIVDDIEENKLLHFLKMIVEHHIHEINHAYHNQVRVK